MRIACASWSRRHVGGIESYLEFVVPALQALGHEVSFWSERDSPADRREVQLPDGVRAWCAETDGLEPSLAALRSWTPSVLFVHGLTEPDIERRLLDVAPSVLLAHSYYGTCISGSKTRRLPWVQPCTRVLGPGCLLHFYPRRCGGLHPATLARDYRRQTDRLALLPEYGAVLTLSAHMRAEYIRHGLSAQRVWHLPRFLPGDAIRAPVAEDRRADTTEVTLLFMGRIDPLKGCGVAIGSLSRVHGALRRPVRLIVAGDGPDREGCERLAAAKARGSVRVSFEGWIDRATRATLLSESDVLVFPSLWPEPYGLSGLEALAAGVPVAAFGSGAIGEWLRDGIDGAVAPAEPPTSAGLAAAIVRCVELGRHEPWHADVILEHQRRHVRAVASHLAHAAVSASSVGVA
jgi:glycosyltransferase involved in cell wall biosynthesis